MYIKVAIKSAFGGRIIRVMNLSSTTLYESELVSGKYKKKWIPTTRARNPIKGRVYFLKQEGIMVQCHLIGLSGNAQELCDYNDAPDHENTTVALEWSGEVAERSAQTPAGSDDVAGGSVEAYGGSDVVAEDSVQAPEGSDESAASPAEGSVSSQGVIPIMNSTEIRYNPEIIQGPLPNESNNSLEIYVPDSDEEDAAGGTLRSSFYSRYRGDGQGSSGSCPSDREVSGPNEANETLLQAMGTFCAELSGIFRESVNHVVAEVRQHANPNEQPNPLNNFHPVPVLCPEEYSNAEAALSGGSRVKHLLLSILGPEVDLSNYTMRQTAGRTLVPSRVIASVLFYARQLQTRAPIRGGEELSMSHIRKKIGEQVRRSTPRRQRVRGRQAANGPQNQHQAAELPGRPGQEAGALCYICRRSVVQTQCVPCGHQLFCWACGPLVRDCQQCQVRILGFFFIRGEHVQETAGETCCICMVRRADTRLSPCDHQQFCRECSERIINCAICRRHITERTSY